jgi:hypothetical protein
MRIHSIPQWLPVTFEPIKKANKPRKQFESEEMSETSETSSETRPPRPSDILDEEQEGQHTDILA